MWKSKFPQRQTAPAIVLLMGVAGCGKSTTGRNLARQLGWEFRDADSFHPASNIEKMSRGEPLTDDDRWPWLDAIGAWMDDRSGAGGRGVVTCSALKRIYRNRLLGSRPDVGLVFLDGDYDTIADRMQRRKGHFMPPALLKSQFAALERPAPEEKALIVPIYLTPKRVVDRVVTEFRLVATAG